MQLSCKIRPAIWCMTSPPGMTAKRNIERDLSKAMEHARVLGSTELDWQAYQRLKFDLKLIDRDANDDGARVDGGGEEIRGTIGFLFSAVLFLVLAVYGGVILRSVVEEKSNRVVEVLIAAVRPEELLLGKVIGMGAVALTQLMAWTVLSTLAFSVFQFAFDSGALGASIPGQVKSLPTCSPPWQRMSSPPFCWTSIGH